MCVLYFNGFTTLGIAVWEYLGMNTSALSLAIVIYVLVFILCNMEMYIENKLPNKIESVSQKTTSKAMVELVTGLLLSQLVTGLLLSQLVNTIDYIYIWVVSQT